LLAITAASMSASTCRISFGSPCAQIRPRLHNYGGSTRAIQYGAESNRSILCRQRISVNTFDPFSTRSVLSVSRESATSSFEALRYRTEKTRRQEGLMMADHWTMTDVLAVWGAGVSSFVAGWSNVGLLCLRLVGKQNIHGYSGPS